MWTKLARQVLRWRALHSLSELIARTITVRFVQFYENMGLISVLLTPSKKNKNKNKIEDFMLCKNESRDPAHCLKEGRRVTRCTTDLWVNFRWTFLGACSYICITSNRLTKMRENCLQQFDAHWECLEKRNQVCISNCRLKVLLLGVYYACRDLA